MSINKKRTLNYLLKYISLTLFAIVFIGYSVLLYTYGYYSGVLNIKNDPEYLYVPYEVEKIVEKEVPVGNQIQGSPSPYLDVDWGGPELWEQ